MDKGTRQVEPGSAPAIAERGELESVAASVAARLVARGETVAVAESSAGGLISAALLALPGASAYFAGGVVVYTAAARQAFLSIDPAAMTGIRSATEPYARMLAQSVRSRLAADWGLAETGAAGPMGNRYGDAPGHVCLAVAGPTADALSLQTGTADRAGNMRAFATAALSLLDDALKGA